MLKFLKTAIFASLLTTLFVSATPQAAAFAVADGAETNVVSEVDALKANLPPGSKVTDLKGAEAEHFAAEVSKLIGPAPFEFDQAVIVFLDDEALYGMVFFFNEGKLASQGRISRSTFNNVVGNKV